MNNSKDLEKMIPLNVHSDNKNLYLENLKKITKDTGKLFLFAGDQKIEHLNKDFYGKDISSQSADPEHLFKIANSGYVGCFATQLGLISKYGNDYKNINYVVKLNSKTDIVQTKQLEPMSSLLNTVQDIVDFKQSSALSIVGVGYTIYLGSENENSMLAQASRIIYDAHKNGLIAILWIYPRGKAVKNELDPELIAGACGVGVCLGADFVKINNPGKEYLTNCVKAAGRTGIVLAGGKHKDSEFFLEELYEQVNKFKISGCAVGRNIHQKDLDNAVRFCKAIYGIIYENIILNDAKNYLKE
ncbi:aldolase [Candidatus Dependentiae bacterium]|nr:aldolase [Candidatus Dependentiae bacterium]